MKRDHKIFIQDVLSAIDSINLFIEGMSFELFRADDKTTSAVIRKFEIIGEAIKHIPNDIREQYPEIPWKDIVGMRDRLIHGYFGIDYKIVWDTINVDLKILKTNLQKVIENM
ncbi:unnamed protein product [marine sediment metagenome]|uniref:DUF86 domain-containing protein n=1 Tax=marine sediment metagenome TaxID=412755 RepID=X1K779_9ZZZZ